MPIEPNIIRYTFEQHGKKLSFDIDTSLERAETIESKEQLPEWTKLSTHQCSCCPLKESDCSHCPAAVRTYEVLNHFTEGYSIEEITLTVENERRTYTQTCDMQNGLNSMLGLLMATSGCPVVGQLRSMATFHLPCSTFVETVYRTLGAYLTKQYFIRQEGGEPDWELNGLKNFYEDLEVLNQAFSERITAIADQDAIANAIVIFFSTSIIIASALEDGLDEYKDYFMGRSTVSPD